MCVAPNVSPLHVKPSSLAQVSATDPKDCPGGVSVGFCWDLLPTICDREDGLWPRGAGSCHGGRQRIIRRARRAWQEGLKPVFIVSRWDPTLISVSGARCHQGVVETTS